MAGVNNAGVLTSASHSKFPVLHRLYKDVFRESAIPVVRTMCTQVYIKIISIFRLE